MYYIVLLFYKKEIYYEYKDNFKVPIDLFAGIKILAIELIPCVQFLAHLARALKWNCTRAYKDTDDILLRPLHMLEQMVNIRRSVT